MTDHAGLYAAPSPGRTAFCGPTALAAATGLPISKVEDTILAFRKRAEKSGRTTPRERKMRGARVKSMYGHEVIPVCRALGFAVSRVGEGGTFRRLAEIMQQGTVTGPVVVLVTGHYIALSRWQFVDNRHTSPTPHEKYSSPRDRVVCAWRLTKIENSERI